MLRRLPLLAAAAVCFGLAAPTVAQANFVGVAEDPAGDASDPNPARDITAAGIMYDRRSGDLRGALRLGGEPGEETRSLIALFAGVRTDSGCNGFPALGFGSYSDEWGASWLRLDGPGDAERMSGDADKDGYLSQVQEFEVSGKELAGRRLDCVIATVSEPGNAANIYDSLGPIPLRGQPALEAELRKVPEALTPGSERRIKLRLRNPGDAPTGRIRLSIKRARGLTVKAPRRLRSIRPGGRRTATITISLSSRAKSFTTLRVTAKAGRLSAHAENEIYLRSPQKPRGGGGGGDDDVESCVFFSPDLSGETGGSLILVPC